MKIFNQIQITSDLSEVKTLAQHFRAFCTYSDLAESVSGLMELALVEAANNIIIHSYERRPGLMIEAVFRITDKDIIIVLTDYGKQFVKKAKNNYAYDEDINALPEGNWGIDLIESIVDELIRDREDNSNTLTIMKRIN